jgi:hypothetical protein
MRVATVWVFSLTVRLSVVMAKRGRYSVRENVRYVTKYITPINPNDRFTIQWEWKETAVLVAMDNDNLEEGTADMVYGLANRKNLPILEQADPWLNGKCQHLFFQA